MRGQGSFARLGLARRIAFVIFPVAAIWIVAFMVWAQ